MKAARGWDQRLKDLAVFLQKCMGKRLLLMEVGPYRYYRVRHQSKSTQIWRSGIGCWCIGHTSIHLLPNVRVGSVKEDMGMTVAYGWLRGLTK